MNNIRNIFIDYIKTNPLNEKNIDNCKYDWALYFCIKCKVILRRGVSCKKNHVFIIGFSYDELIEIQKLSNNKIKGKKD